MLSSDAVDRTKPYGTKALVLQANKYKDHEWQLCYNLKVVVRLIGLQDWSTKGSCFLYLQDSRDSKNYYTIKKLHIRNRMYV